VGRERQKEKGRKPYAWHTNLKTEIRSYTVCIQEGRDKKLLPEKAEEKRMDKEGGKKEDDFADVPGEEGIGGTKRRTGIGNRNQGNTAPVRSVRKNIRKKGPWNLGRGSVANGTRKKAQGEWRYRGDRKRKETSAKEGGIKHNRLPWKGNQE